MKTLELEQLDDAAKQTWDLSYDVKKTPNLWGGEPLPFVSKAIEVFQADHAVKILDLPCGDGRNTMPLAKAIPFVVAADSSHNGLDLTRNLMAAHAIENCVCQHADIFATQFRDDQFDGVFCSDVLGHLKQAPRALLEMVRVCRPGKCVIGNFFAIGDSTRGIDMEPLGQEEYLFAGKFYFKYYERAEVLQLLHELPVEIVAVDLATWMEPPHEGYREYAHEHQSWVFVIRKRDC